jgi:protein-S-isoprenylcysteine O-methyltransferase Ste14
MDHDQDARAELQIDMARLKKAVAIRVVFVFVFMGLMFFWPAGTFRYWQAWVYISVLLIPMLFVIAWLFRNEPELLERRIRMKEKERDQKAIIRWASIVILTALVLPGIDRRLGWSSVPLAIVIIADLIVLAGYGLCVLVFKENRYASRVVEVAAEQSVITTGPYSLIRHPMYLAVLIMYILSPLALGSYWAVLPALLLIFVLVARIRNEEKVLAEKLPGYREYLQRVRFRLIPGIW